MTILVGLRVRLTPEAQDWMFDVRDRIGTVTALDGWPIVLFDGVDGDKRIHPNLLEVVDG